MKKRIISLLLCIMMIFSSVGALAFTDEELNTKYSTTKDKLIESASSLSVGSTGGEWVVIGLARSGVSQDSEFFNTYVTAATKYIKEHINANEQLSKNKSSDNSRMILALTSIGVDVTNIEIDGVSHNLVYGLTDFNYVKKQGINGAIWALIALDSRNYTIPTNESAAIQTTREVIIEHLLSKELEDGGWALTGTKSDPDITAMTIQSLSPYYSKREDVKTAVDKALGCLSDMQLSDGGYDSWGTRNSESAAQVLVALSSLNIDATTDERFVKNDKNIVDSILSYYVEGGGFKHIMSGEVNGMATEQAFYALTSYIRMKEGKTSLYDMSDVVIKHECVPSDWIIVEPATTQKDGYKIKECTICHKELEREVLPKLETECIHEHTHIEGYKDSTCVAKGYTGDVVCDDCLEIVTYGEEITQLKDHQYEDGECTVCGAKDPDYEKDTDPKGSSKKGVIIIDGKEYVIDEQTQNAIEIIDKAINEPTDENVIEAYRVYNELTSDQKLFCSKISELDPYAEKIGEKNHISEDGLVKIISDNVSWNIKLISEIVSNSDLGSVLDNYSDANKIVSYRVRLVDILTGNDVEPKETIDLELSGVNTDKDNVIVLLKDSNKVTVFETELTGDTVKVSTQKLGVFNVVGFSNEIEKTNVNWLWIVLGILAVAGLISVVIIKRKNKNE